LLAKFQLKRAVSRIKLFSKKLNNLVMKAIKTILVVLSCCATIVTSEAQRNIILSHGFGGDDATWNAYQPELRRTLTTPLNIARASYNSNPGVASGANQIRNQVANNSQNIAVAHSMGGLVWRELDRQSPGQKAGGIITLGTPNRGGAMLNALRAGTVQAELQDGCNKIGGAIGSSLIALNVSGVGGGLAMGAGSALVIFKNRLCSEVISTLNTGLPTNTVAQQAAADMSEGSAMINGLTNSNTPTFKIGVFGVENSPVHVRLFSSFRNSPSAQPIATTLAASNTDEELVDIFNTVNDVVATAENVFIVAAIAFSAAAWWNWAALFPAVVCAWAAWEWSDLRRWLAQSESKWHAIIGAGGFFTETVNTRVFTCNAALDDIFDLWESRQITGAQMRLMRANLFASPNCFTVMPVQINFPINNQSDGLFNAGTAQIPRDPNSVDHVDNQPVEGANHQELLNHFNMTAKFRAIFAGNTAANRFFITQ
jgi:pimeloyl-ACP methyl ester carboxylesterase